MCPPDAHTRNKYGKQGKHTHCMRRNTRFLLVVCQYHLRISDKYNLDSLVKILAATRRHQLKDLRKARLQNMIWQQLFKSLVVQTGKTSKQKLKRIYCNRKYIECQINMETRRKCLNSRYRAWTKINSSTGAGEKNTPQCKCCQICILHVQMVEIHVQIDFNLHILETSQKWGKSSSAQRPAAC